MAVAARKKPKVNQKKRQARHHRQSRHYLKAYFPYIPMLMIVGIGVAINSMWNTAGVLGAKSDFSPAALLSETNSRRAEQNQAALTLDPQLSAAAQAKADDMAASDYWAHNSPDGKTPWTFISGSGYQYLSAGENLAYGFNSAGNAVKGWMNSPEHRANILSADYQNVGFGVASSPNYQGKGPEIIVVAEYGQPVATAANISFTVPETAANKPVRHVRGGATELSAKPVSRIDVLTGGSLSWATMAVSAIAGAAFAMFITRHGFRIQRTLVKGEAFIVHHPKFDIAIVVIFTAGIVLTRTSGIIR